MPTAAASDAIMGATTAVRAAGRVLARPSTSLAPRIVILGGGFAGVTAALELAKRCAGLLPYRAVVVLRDIEELSNEETAQILNEPVSSVKSRLHRARMALREQLTLLMTAAEIPPTR